MANQKHKSFVFPHKHFFLAITLILSFPTTMKSMSLSNPYLYYTNVVTMLLYLLQQQPVRNRRKTLVGEFLRTLIMALVGNEEFQHILRVHNTNVDGEKKVMFAMASIKGISRLFSDIICKKADGDMNKRAGELSDAEIDSLMTIVANPRQLNIPDWFLNRQKDYKEGKYSQVVSNALDMKLRGAPQES